MAADESVESYTDDDIRFGSVVIDMPGTPIQASLMRVMLRLAKTVGRLTKERDEARAAARTLAGLWNQLDERCEPSDAQKDAYQAALTYPDTTKETDK